MMMMMMIIIIIYSGAIVPKHYHFDIPQTGPH